MPGRVYTPLRDMALDHHGFLTTDHARQLGVDPHRLQVMEGRGLVERVSRGVFRFADVPAGALDQYMEAVLWPFPAQGVLSHDTALDLHDLCDVNPSRIHVTVPAGYRTTRDVPPLFELHRKDLPREEIGWHDGIPIVSVRQAIRGSAENHVGWNLIDQAITTARRHGRVTVAEARQLRSMRPSVQAAS
jgi:predicted transcriptional regulator of viral defense system